MLDDVSGGVDLAVAAEAVVPAGVGASAEGAAAVLIGAVLVVGDAVSLVVAVDGAVAFVDEPGIALAPELL